MSETLSIRLVEGGLRGGAVDCADESANVDGLLRADCGAPSGADGLGGIMLLLLNCSLGP